MPTTPESPPVPLRSPLRLHPAPGRQPLLSFLSTEMRFSRTFSGRRAAVCGFCVWPRSISTICLPRIQAVANFENPNLFLAKQCSLIRLYHLLFMPSPAPRQLGCFCCLLLQTLLLPPTALSGKGCASRPTGHKQRQRRKACKDHQMPLLTPGIHGRSWQRVGILLLSSEAGPAHSGADPTTCCRAFRG